ncbi:hypothetical protein DCO58_09520 [Helicobacter saguini]|uniref:Uncharacterized protein n=1 Tax=Helicobacter saguini TaxID=1548018 RepID=A0A347VPA5_9HELI|nr:hypothetical protein [Helicobacter saguini]MWV61444.1 hypothetical protein [Helicobacter saguini]MWV67885.1 hypothetical protein [Helicobacter saguini]MWV70646.1 hypothetical protein [Helicobacter saguini]MWV72551.1 hypothetical protein [Helicobacter saguini]TLD94712.1 hypothetical protein LS64_004105 [Helicobacter saguini]
MDDIVKEDISTIIGQIQDYLDELESHFEKLESKNVKNSETIRNMIEEMRLNLETLQDFQDSQ